MTFMPHSLKNIEQQTILLIDDSENDILLTKMVLTKITKKIRVETALSGEAGLAFLRSGNALPSLILLDLKMPRMDGVEVLIKMRGEARLCSIPVVIVTHSELESDKQTAVKAGANSFLQKSTNPDNFKRDLERELDCWLGKNSPHI
jgi:two-component system response regulator